MLNARPTCLISDRAHDIRSVQSHQLVAGMAQHAADAGVGVEVVSLGVGDEDAIRRILKERAIAHFAQAQLLLRPHALLFLAAGVGGEGDVACQRVEQLQHLFIEVARLVAVDDQHPGRTAFDGEGKRRATR